MEGFDKQEDLQGLIPMPLAMIDFDVPQSRPQQVKRSQRSPEHMMSDARSVFTHQGSVLSLRTFQYLATDVTNGR